MRNWALSLAVFLGSGVGSLAQTVPAEEGYVTAVRSATDFDADGYRVVLKAGVKALVRRDGKESEDTAGPYVGEPIEVYGRLDKKRQEVNATGVVFEPTVIARVKGVAVIDRVLTPLDAEGNGAVRADGYRMQLESATKRSFDEPLKAAVDISTNAWMAYEGTLDADGVVHVTTARFSANVVTHSEARLQDSAEYDPKKVDESKRQSGLSRAMLGTDVKKIPAIKDPAVQARVERIGQSLVPAYQKALPQKDPTRIEFRFQTVEGKHWRDGMAMPNGIILISQEVVERMQNDSQLAAVLADNIATALEKQGYLGLTGDHVLSAAKWMSVAGMVVSPLPGYVANRATHHASERRRNTREDQSGRVALSLMHDAGYDLREAPVAWWRLAAKNPANLLNMNMPDRVVNLYEMLGVEWRAETMAR